MEIIKQYRDGNERHDIVCLAGETLFENWYSVLEDSCCLRHPSSRTPWTGRTEQSDPTPRTKPNHKTEVHKMAWLYIPAETGERIETICNQHYNPGRGACDCPLWPACSYSNDLTKSNAENTRIFEQGMAAALAALDNENRR